LQDPGPLDRFLDTFIERSPGIPPRATRRSPGGQRNGRRSRGRWSGGTSGSRRRAVSAATRRPS